MNFAEMLSAFFVVMCVLASLYVAFSRDLLRTSIAFFIELASVGGVLLGLNADYLALIMFMVGLMGTVLVISFASVIMGSLKESLKSKRTPGSSGKERATRALGMILGLSVGAAIGWAFLTAPFLQSSEVVHAETQMDVDILGKTLLGDQVVVFEILAVMVLLVVIGAGLLLRKPKDAN